MSVATNLDAAVRAVAPINGISIGNLADKATWLIDFQAGATAQQRTDAATVLAAFDITADDTRSATFRADAGRIDLLDRLKTATPAQIDAWLAANVTTLAQARAVLAAIIKVVALDART